MAEEKVIQVGGAKAEAAKAKANEKPSPTPKKKGKKKKTEDTVVDIVNETVDVNKSEVKYTEIDVDSGKVKGEVKPSEDPVVEYDEKNTTAPKSTLVGDKNCYVFFSMHTTNDGPDAEIIDIGFTTNLTKEDGSPKTFYVQFTDYDIKKVNGDVFENTIRKLPDEYDCKGTRLECGLAIYEWFLANFITQEIFVQFMTSCNVYEFGLLRKLIKDTGKDVRFMSPIVGDINQDLATSLFSQESSDKNYVPIFVAASAVSKEKALEVMTKNDKDIWERVQAIECPALKNAEIFKTIHWYLWGKY